MSEGGKHKDNKEWVGGVWASRRTNGVGPGGAGLPNRIRVEGAWGSRGARESPRGRGREREGRRMEVSARADGEPYGQRRVGGRGRGKKKVARRGGGITGLDFG